VFFLIPPTVNPEKTLREEEASGSQQDSVRPNIHMRKLRPREGYTVEPGPRIPSALIRRYTDSHRVV
jgi:hypothetical protein